MARFGSALHYTISQCANSGFHLHLVSPPTIGHDELRLREAKYVANKRHHQSGLGDGLFTESAGGDSFLTQSFAAQSKDGYPTPSAGGFLTQSIGDAVFPTRSEAVISATATSVEFPSFTGAAPRIKPSAVASIAIIIAGYYLAS